MKKIFKKLLVSICFIALLVLPVVVLAETQSTNNLKIVGENGNAPYKSITPGTNDLAGIIGSVIEAFLGLLGVLFLIYTLYGGYSWMTAQGDEDRVTKAKDTIQRAIIGLIVTIAAYAISYWVFDRLLASGIIA